MGLIIRISNFPVATASIEINPTRYVSEISPIPVMYNQAEKDEIGDVSDVKAMSRNRYPQRTDRPGCPPFWSLQIPGPAPQACCGVFY